jgi:hypothetical protein
VMDKVHLSLFISTQKKRNLLILDCGRFFI